MEASEHSSTGQEGAGLPIPRGASQARPRLAVLIPVFNGQEALERSLASLYDGGERFEVFIVDDGSDPPIEVPPGLPFTVKSMRMPQNGGITKALNTGLAPIMEAGYEYIARLDAGAISLSGRFTAQMAFLDAHPDHAVVGTHTEYVDAQGKRLFVYRPPSDDAALARYLKRRNGLEHPTVMMRAAALAAAGGYDERYSGSEDYELWRRLMTRYKLANLHAVFVKKEVPSAQITARPFRSATRLRVQMRYFDPLSLDAYFGVFRSLLALLTSGGLVIRAKQWGQRLRLPMAEG